MIATITSPLKAIMQVNKINRWNFTTLKHDFFWHIVSGLHIWPIKPLESNEIKKKSVLAIDEAVYWI